jgi:hypothetical protein
MDRPWKASSILHPYQLPGLGRVGSDAQPGVLERGEILLRELHVIFGHRSARILRPVGLDSVPPGEVDQPLVATNSLVATQVIRESGGQQGLPIATEKKTTNLT